LAAATTLLLLLLPRGEAAGLAPALLLPDAAAGLLLLLPAAADVAGRGGMGSAASGTNQRDSRSMNCCGCFAKIASQSTYI
jgi:hypothetical protein